MNRKIKVLYTIPNFDTAGSGKVLYDLANGLDTHKFEVSIACSNTKGAFYDEVEALGLPIYIRPVTQPLKPYFSLPFRLKEQIKFIKKHNIDIVHSWHWSSDWSEALATRIAGAKFVYTKKAMTWGNVHWKIRSYLSNYILTMNEEMKNYFPNRKNQKLIPLGLNTDYYDFSLFKKDSSPLFKIVTVANLVPIKAIEVLIQAVKLLNNEKIYLEILGDDKTPYASQLKELVVELKMENQVAFLGKHSDVRPFLAQADLYIMPSLKEGFGMALVEAMSMGLVTLGSNISGINYVLKDFPELLFEVGNAADLADKITFWLNLTDKQRLEKGEILRDYAVKYFSVKKFIKEHEDLYLYLSKT